MGEYMEPQQIEHIPLVQNSFSWYWIIIIFLLSISYLYIAIKEYPKWRNLRENFFTRSKKKSETNSAKQPPQQKNPLLYIPFIPFAAIYLLLRIIWDLFRLFVFYSLDSIEAGLKLFWRLIIWGIKVIPKICEAILSLWNTYIQTPFIKMLNWMYLWVWPIFKSIVITTWNLCVITCTEGQKFLIHLWNISVKCSKIGWEKMIHPSLKFMSWIIMNLMVEPGKWVLSKSIYLGRITWYCACFLAKDLVKDFRDLSHFGWKIFLIIYDNVLKPTGKFLHHSIVENYQYYFPILQNFLYLRFVLAATNEISFIFYEIFGDPLFHGLIGLINSIIQSRTLYNLVKKNLPKFMNRMRHCRLELMESSFRSTMETMRSTYYTYFSIILPIIIEIPIIYNEFKRSCNKFYKNVKEHVVKVLTSLWTIFAPLLRPVILALSFFYTTVILFILLESFRVGKWMVSMSITAFVETLVLVKRVLSALYFKLESIYNVLSPYISSILQMAKNVMYELYIAINDFMAQYFPSFVNYFMGIISSQVQSFKDYIIKTYGMYEPVVLELKDRVKVSADEVVIRIGQKMMEWVKEE